LSSSLVFFRLGFLATAPIFIVIGGLQL